VDSFEFSAELWIWDARAEEAWTFISVPLEASEEIRAFSATRPRAGFGSVRVSVTVGGSSWRTSVFPSEDGSYALPIKKAIRRAEAIETGDVVPVTLRIIER
jgi:Domain of unknown function (DUF1905)